ncbi:lipopolysaccharide biosynthesis protein [Roseovarius tibetensis]|uniref:lipopolysaccharide biosynthesis protein n=1 Tax=Roseovarius tibetensis TaxID=2685897 RepID=UPI003D7FA780
MAPLRAVTSIVALQILGAATALLVVMVVVGALGPDGYGRYAWVLSIGGVGALLLQRGLPMTLIKRFAPLDMDALAPPSAIANTLWFYVLLSGGSFFAAMIIMPASSDISVSRPEIVWVLPLAAALACLAISDAILRAAERAVRAQFASQVLRSGGLLAGSFLLTLVGVDQPEAYLALYAASALLSALVFTWPLLIIASQHWRNGAHVSSTPAHFQVSLSRSIGNHLPVFITGFFVPPDILAYLAIAVRITGPVQFGLTASRAHFGARINHHVKTVDFDAVRQDYRAAKMYSAIVGGLTALAVLGLVTGLTRLPVGPFTEFTDTALLLTLCALVTVFQMSLVIHGPVQLVAILLGGDRFARNLNLIMLGLLACGLVVAGLIGQILLSAAFMILYGAFLTSGVALSVSKMLHASSLKFLSTKQDLDGQE